MPRKCSGEAAFYRVDAYSVPTAGMVNVVWREVKVFEFRNQIGIAIPILVIILGSILDNRDASFGALKIV
jgi:hypothetical protein